MKKIILKVLCFMVRKLSHNKFCINSSPKIIDCSNLFTEEERKQMEEWEELEKLREKEIKEGKLKEYY